MYKIRNYSFQKAKILNVRIEPSTRLNKKIKVTDEKGNVFHIGDSRYKDYTIYLEENKTLAEERRKLYHARHKGETAAEFYAREILW